MKKQLVACIIIALAFQGYLFGNTLRVESLSINTSGSTSPSAVSYFVEIEEGDEFANEETLNAALQEDVQRLINLQTFETVSSSVNPTPGVLGGVDVTIDIQDSWNLFPVPVFKFDSNRGWKAGAKLKYPNAFGSLMNLEASANIEQRNNTWKEAQIYADLSLSRIRLFDSYSSVKFITQHNLGTKKYTFDLDGTMGFKIKEHPLTGYVNLGYSNEIFRSDFGLATNLYFLDRSLTYTPKILFEFGHKKGFFNERKNLLITQTLQSGSINWQGYFRTGYNIKFVNNTRFFLDGRHLDYADTRVWSDFTVQFTQFHLLKNSNIKWRIKGYARTAGQSDLGGDLRGLLNSSLKGDMALLANIDWVFRAASWNGEGFFEWVGGGEFHIAPFIDMGIAIFQQPLLPQQAGHPLRLPLEPRGCSSLIRHEALSSVAS